MAKKSEKVQTAAYEAHQRGEAALDAGDLETAFCEDRESADLAVQAMFKRHQEDKEESGES
jgi:hypothetical protein